METLGLCGHIGEVNVADLRVSIPPKHRVDGLGELGAGGLVDAYGVDPYVLVSIVSGLFNSTTHFGDAKLVLIRSMLHIVGLYLMSTFCPSMGKNGVRRNSIARRTLPLAAPARC